MRLRTLIATVMAASVFAGAASAVTLSGSSGSKPAYGPAAPQAQTEQALPGNYQAKTSQKKGGIEPLRGPWRLTKSLKNKGKEPVDENGNTYACMDQACKVSRKVDEKRD